MTVCCCGRGQPQPGSRWGRLQCSLCTNLDLSGIFPSDSKKKGREGKGGNGSGWERVERYMRKRKEGTWRRMLRCLGVPRHEILDEPLNESFGLRFNDAQTLVDELGEDGFMHRSFDIDVRPWGRVEMTHNTHEVSV